MSYTRLRSFLKKLALSAICIINGFLAACKNGATQRTFGVSFAIRWNETLPDKATLTHSSKHGHRIHVSRGFSTGEFVRRLVCLPARCSSKENELHLLVIDTRKTRKFSLSRDSCSSLYSNHKAEALTISPVRTLGRYPTRDRSPRLK